jgi:hypothetical protein
MPSVSTVIRVLADRLLSSRLAARRQQQDLAAPDPRFAEQSRSDRGGLAGTGRGD